MDRKKQLSTLAVRWTWKIYIKSHKKH